MGSILASPCSAAEKSGPRNLHILPHPSRSYLAAVPRGDAVLLLCERALSMLAGSLARATTAHSPRSTRRGSQLACSVQRPRRRQDEVLEESRNLGSGSPLRSLGRAVGPIPSGHRQ
eukprot:scaffold82230_cov73-Phaeocystis_antarctica.AAC.8